MARTISIVGAGRVGRTLGKRLRQLGWRVGAVVTRSAASSRAAVRAIGAGLARSGITIDAAAADVVLLATPDDALAGVASALAEISGKDWRGKIVLHTSGTLDRTVLAPLARRGAATGSLHPMQTFSGRGVPNLAGIIFAVEGDPKARGAAQAIARALGGVPVVIDSRDKPAYHAAAVLVAGSGFPLIESGVRMLMRIGFTRRRAFQTLLPLTRQMLDNVERIGPRAAWTGPLSRGDFAVIAKHAKALRGYPRELQHAYAALAHLAARVLSRKPASAVKRLKRALTGR
jgi:predicted short-subunit dehydrogenase-like oxidoreductase (DUF2520 family)